MIFGLRALKRFMVAFIGVGVVLILILYGGKFFAKPIVTPTPDPLAGILPLEIISTQIFKIKEGDYDILARVKNINQDYGSGDVQYSLKLYYESAGNTDAFETRDGSFYILPGQTKYLVITPVSTTNAIKKVELTIVSVQWQELNSLALNGVNFSVTNSSYSNQSQSGVTGRVRGFISNGSDFDVNRVDVAIMLLDEQEKIIAINRTEIYTFLSHTTRGFEVVWFNKFAGTVSKVLIEPTANLLKQSSFIRTYGGQERFQSY